MIFHRPPDDVKFFVEQLFVGFCVFAFFDFLSFYSSMLRNTCYSCASYWILFISVSSTISLENFSFAITKLVYLLNVASKIGILSMCCGSMNKWKKFI